MKVTREIFYFKLSADSRSAATSTPTMPTETSYIAIIPEKEEAILRGNSGSSLRETKLPRFVRSAPVD